MKSTGSSTTDKIRKAPWIYSDAKSTCADRQASKQQQNKTKNTKYTLYLQTDAKTTKCSLKLRNIFSCCKSPNSATGTKGLTYVLRTFSKA